MKRTITLLSVITILTGYSFASSQKVQAASTTKKTITVLDKGIKRHITIPSVSSKKANSKQQSNTKDGVIVVFKDSTLVSIGELETKYGLRLKNKLVIGYHIFDNQSSISDSDIVKNIIENENNVKTVKPNWKKRNIIR